MSKHLVSPLLKVRINLKSGIALTEITIIINSPLTQWIDRDKKHPDNDAVKQTDGGHCATPDGAV